MSDISLYCLRCLDRRKAFGIDEKPYFSWKFKADENNVFQKYYHIVVSKDGEEVWDSGDVKSDRNSAILYEGEELEPFTVYSWRVTSTFNCGKKAEACAEFTTGVFDKDGLLGKFITGGYERKPISDSTDAAALLSHKIGSHEHPEETLDPPVYFRKSFRTDKKIKKAYAIATSLGIYSLYIDNKKVSNILAPEYTSYNKHLEYQLYDVTDIIRGSSRHVIGAILADGWYTGKIGLMGIGEQYGHENAVSFQLRIEYDDGSVENICSDEKTKVTIGEYIYADIFVGEFLDLNRHKDYFDVSLDDSEWDSAKVIEVDKNILKAQSVEPVEAVEVIRPTLLITPKGEIVLDAEKNVAGYTRFSTDCEKGTEIGLEHSEILDADGNFYQNITGQNKNQKDRIIAAATHTVYEPQFTFHGFRYVKVTGLEKVDPKDFEIVVITSPMDITGSFECSDERLSSLQRNIINSQKGNMICIPTDCPQRERAGWTGDMEVYAPTAAFNMDVRCLLKRWMSDVRNDQLPDGQIRNISPYIDSDKYVNGETGGSHVSSAGWGDAIVLVPYALYQAYGDVNILKDNYNAMESWMKYVKDQAGEGMLGWGKLFHFGDWLIPSIMAETGNPILTALQTKEETALAYLAKTADCLGEIALVLHKENDAEIYFEMAAKARKAFSQAFVDEKGIMKQQLQGLYVLALHEHMLDTEQEEGAKKRLVELVQGSGCLDTGFLSVPFLLDTLCEIGRPDLAYNILMDDKKPGWLYALKYGATTIWENWAAVRPDGTRTDSSYNHFAFGCVGDFLYRKIGGIYREEPGYRKVRIDPDYNCGLNYAKTGIDSIYGKILCEWHKKDNAISLKVVLPPGTSGVINAAGRMVEVGNGSFEFSF